VLSASFSSLWKSILNEVKSLKAQGVDLISHCKIRVGNGMHTSFWNDCWIDDSMLKHLFPRLFALETIKDISVADKFRVPITCSFRRPVFEGVKAQRLDQFSWVLLNRPLLSNCEVVGLRFEGDDWQGWFKQLRLGAKSKEVLEGVFYVSWWSLWNFRNHLLFADSNPRKDAIFDEIVLRSFNWCLARGKIITTGTSSPRRLARSFSRRAFSPLGVCDGGYNWQIVTRISNQKITSINTHKLSKSNETALLGHRSNFT
ncbi:hypothetical protein Tco_0924674, partial [Tanacetum coccineum]